MVVQKLTEMGVDRILPLTAERSVVRWDDAKAAVGHLSTAGGVVMAEPGGDPVDGTVRVLVVGPEGGWTVDELAGHRTVGLGSTVLRAEAAAIAAGTLLTVLRDGRVAPSL